MAAHATPVCEISNGGVTTYRWLCEACQARRKKTGWSVKPTEKMAAWPCDDCPRQPTAPAVTFAPTLAGATARKPAPASTAKAKVTSVDKGLFE